MAVVREELEILLGCGILSHGFVRVRCAACGHDRLVAFSCKGRGFACAAWAIASTSTRSRGDAGGRAPNGFARPLLPPYRARVDYAVAVAMIREAVPGTIAVYLFGSRARGDAGGQSDVDLAVLGTTPLDPLARFELQERVAGALRAVSVDLVDLRRASAVLRVQVLEHAQLLYEGDPRERARFEVAALSAYARLNEERRGILQDIARTGRVHG